MNLLRAFWHSPAALNWAFRLLISAGLIGTLWLAGLWISQQPVFALRSVVVTAAEADGLRHISEADLRQALEAGQVSHILASSLQPAQQTLSAHPWVRQVSLRRVWPSRLLVRIEEHRPIAAWSDGQLLNQQGEIFVGEKSAALDDAETLYHCRLVELSGPVGSHGRVLSRALATEDLLTQHGQTLASLTLSPQASWLIRLDDDLSVLLGREDLATDWQTRLGQALESLPKLDQWVGQSAPDARLLRLDLRYANGFAFATQPKAGTTGSQTTTEVNPSCLKHYRQGSRHAA